jgi:hypothetical protein
MRQYQIDALRAAGIVMPVDDFGRFDVICEGRQASYDTTFGLRDAATLTNTDDFIV